jgi:hypothetical protein
MTNQDLFKQAIADAKSVRDAAVANAKAALEETFTPSIMNMLNNKLNEMEDDMEKKEGMKEKEEGYSMEEAKGKPQIIVPANDAYDLDEEAEYFKEMLSDAGIMADVKAGFGELEIYLTNPMEKRKATKVINDAGYSLDEGMKEKEEGYSMEEMNLEEILAELEKEEGSEKEEGKKKDVEEAKKTEEKGKKKVEEAEDKEKMEEAEGDDEITELTVDELKDMIRDVLEDVLGSAEKEAGEEEMEAGEEESEEAEDEESIDLDELLAELDSMEEGKEKEKVEEKKEKDGEKVEEAKKKEVEEAKKEAKKAKEDLEEAIKVIKFLKKELNEVNLLNAKNTYVNKIFKTKSLSESQKVNVLKNMDKATNVKEAKVIYESLVSTLSTSKKNSIKESIGFASKASGVAPKQPIVESDAAIRRMQQLAGIIK